VTPRKPGSWSLIPRLSWPSSLRPNATSLRPNEEQPPAAPTSRINRLHVALGCALACAAVAGIATWRSQAHRSRGKPVPSVVSGRAGLRKTPSGADERWYTGALTVTIDPTLAQATPSARDAIVSAFGAWASSDASLPQLSFDVSSTPGQAAQDGVNRLLLGPITAAGHEDALAITISYVDTEGAVVEADTIFNNAYDWAAIDPAEDNEDEGDDRCRHRYDLQNVATHEAGHFFGLGEDYGDESTTMYVSSKTCQTSKRTLSKPDISVVTGLYAESPVAPQRAGCGR